MSAANERQVGGDHYRKVPGEQHWDRAVRLKMDFFQYMITKYVERAPLKNGKQDAEKALHFCQKWLESWDLLYGKKQTDVHIFHVQADTSQATAALKTLHEQATAVLETLQSTAVARDAVAAAQGNAADLDWLMQNVVLTPTGYIDIGTSRYSCLRGSMQQFHREGGFGDGRTMWTCARCREKVYTTGQVLPHAVHNPYDCRLREQRAEAHHADEMVLCAACENKCVPEACISIACPHQHGVVRNATLCEDRMCGLALTDENISACTRPECKNKPNDVAHVEPVRPWPRNPQQRSVTGEDRAVQGAEAPAIAAK